MQIKWSGCICCRAIK